jgi:hypothetical protein
LLADQDVIADGAEHVLEAGQEVAVVPLAPRA